MLNVDIKVKAKMGECNTMDERWLRASTHQPIKKQKEGEGRFHYMGLRGTYTAYTKQQMPSRTQSKDLESKTNRPNQSGEAVITSLPLVR